MVSDNIEILQNTGYGAVELKKIYQKYLIRALIGAMIVHFIAIGSFAFANYLNRLSDLEKQKQILTREINLTDLEPPPSATDEEEPPPPKYEEPLSNPPKNLAELIWDPVAKEKAEKDPLIFDKEQPITSDGSKDTGKFVYSGQVKIEEKKVEEKVKVEEKKTEKTTYQAFEVEKPPECVNLSQVRASMKYPEIAKESGIEGKVTVKVLVGESGNVIKVGSVSGNDVFADEVKDKAADLQFTPGLQNGKPVKVWVNVPFNFKLKN